ncbi:hypothetical protein MML48_2g00018933 [Holotrichia oblita]|uniref:Uncharacterized protein n=2 Tax=Holotrichia oblita TaxID=644536 RepID=A0ACB9TJL6_HOLOL|nr:hypothetical protein MML48_2g00014122 [Holotrichia oblita]KAI4466903.1 hypothetical protein MML48_2g00018933 [Holotrichia oblita]
MDELMEQYQNLKISAYDKLNEVNKLIHDVTLGPNSTYRDEPDTINRENEIKQRTKYKPKSNAYVRPPVSDLRILLKMKELERLKQTQELIAQKQKLFVEQQKMRENRMRERWIEKQKELLLQVEHQEMQIFQAEEEHDKNSLLQNEQRQRYYQELEEKRRRRGSNYKLRSR